jgi:large subunit ribosomal protein L10
MSREAKAALKDKVAERLKKANSAIIAEFRGLTVQELTDLRVKLRATKAEFKVIKNRIAKVALKDGVPAIAPVSDRLRGPVGIVICYGDPAAAAKAVLEFGKDKENFKVTGGAFDGKAVTPAELKVVADLPSKEVLLARLVGTLVAPHRGILGVLNGVPRQLVYAINAIKEKKSS